MSYLHVFSFPCSAWERTSDDALRHTSHVTITHIFSLRRQPHGSQGVHLSESIIMGEVHAAAVPVFNTCLSNIFKSSIQSREKGEQ